MFIAGWGESKISTSEKFAELIGYSVLTLGLVNMAANKHRCLFTTFIGAHIGWCFVRV